jgi:hypothetical protein
LRVSRDDDVDLAPDELGRELRRFSGRVLANWYSMTTFFPST